MSARKYTVKNEKLLNKCEDAIVGLSEFHNNLTYCVDFLQGCVDEGIVPPENLNSNIYFLYSLNGRTCELLEMVTNYIAKLENTEENIQFIEKTIWQDKQIISTLERWTCSLRDYEDLASVLSDSIGSVEYWCAQKWLNGRASPAIRECVLSLENKCFTLMPLLQSLNVMVEEHLNACENITSISFVYASPEMMGDNPIEDMALQKAYPYSYAVENEATNQALDIEEDLMMKELYGGPAMLSHAKPYTDISEKAQDISGISDPDETVQFCRQCGRDFAIRLTVCPYCGAIAREERNRGLEIEDDSSMACVYASPEMMGFQVQTKRDLFGKLSGGTEGKKK